MMKKKSEEYWKDGKLIPHPQAAWDFKTRAPATTEIDKAILDVLETTKPAKKRAKQAGSESEEEEEAPSSQQQERDLMKSILRAAQALAAPPAPQAAAAPAILTCARCDCRNTRRDDLKDIPLAGTCPSCMHPHNLHP